MPTDTAKRAAKTIIADLRGEPDDEAVFSPLPSFWSDQYDLRLQGYGAPGDGDDIRLLEGNLNETSTPPIPLAGAVIGYYHDDRLVGVVMVSPSPNQSARYRGDVEAARAALQPV